MNRKRKADTGKQRDKQANKKKDRNRETGRDFRQTRGDQIKQNMTESGTKGDRSIPGGFPPRD